MEVIRTKAVDRYTPVTNIYFDGEKKWVGNRKGLFQVHSPEQATNANLAPLEWSLMQTPSGNRDTRLPLEDLLTQMGADGESIRKKGDRITAAIFEEKGSQLWVGTRKSGLFQFKTQPALKLVERHTPGGSREINTLFLDTEGRLWIGTADGCLFGNDGKWKQEQKFFSIRAFAQSGTSIWVMGDDLLWKVDAREKWDPIDIDANLTEGEVVDIAVDGNGMLWVASQIVTRYDPATEKATVFGPAEEFTSQDVSCMAIDAENAVWIGTNDKGLYLIQKADAIAVTCLLDHHLSCGANKKDASLKVTVSGGEAPYTYTWLGGLSGINPQNLGPGEYSLTVTDSKGKLKSTKFTIPDPNITLAAAQDKPAGESGAADGAASVKVTGGNPPYTYKWDNGETAAKATALGDGPHSVVVTDKAGCAATATVDIKRLVAALNVAIAQTKAIGCAGAKDAAIKAEVSGGKTPYQYQWNTPSLMTGANLTGLPAGGYSVTVTDATGQSASASFDVKNVEPITANIKVDAPASTGNSDGKATVKVTGGSGNFTFKWDNAEATATATKLGPGSHSVTVTDQTGCTSTAVINITENILPLAVTIAQQSEIKCYGEKSAILQTKVNGGKEPYKYSWSLAGATNESASGLSAGNYSLTVTDATGQTATASLEVFEPKPFNLTVRVEAPASPNKADGKATVKTTGGIGNLAYKWENGETTATAAKLGLGTHSLAVTDAAGCTATASVSITENILPLEVSISQEKEIKCAGEKTGEIKAEASGGKQPFKYQWSGGGASGEMVGSLPSGSYSVTVTDATGQTATNKAELSEPKPITLTAKVDASASTGNSDGKATVKASGGTGNFSFKWSNGETTASATKLGPTSHTVTVTDAAGCTATTSVSITENILPLEVSISQENEIKCAGEKTASLKADVSGGKPPFRYSWSGGSTSASVNSLGAGSYTVTITDATGATSSATKQLAEPAVLKAEVARIRPATTDKTNNGKASLEATGGTGKHQIAWDNGEAEANATALPAGQHTVTVTDENGCSAITSFETKTRIIPELSGNNIRSGETIKLEKIYFEQDSTNMDESSRPTLDELYEFLQENPAVTIEVGGHTNGIPSHEFCDNLSSLRAKSVAQYLVDLGLPTSRITYKGYGKRNPVASNSTPEGRAKNQRVEIKIVRTE
ncbi:MAG: OmpA family protein [Bacteroidales bacterium]|nr:OmpA family protein [Bacteroidales bacterium]MCF8439824.1 OmpA family protein [Saprospiraceae bacterium]